MKVTADENKNKLNEVSLSKNLHDNIRALPPVLWSSFCFHNNLRTLPPDMLSSSHFYDHFEPLTIFSNIMISFKSFRQLNHNGWLQRLCYLLLQQSLSRLVLDGNTHQHCTRHKSMFDPNHPF